MKAAATATDLVMVGTRVPSDLAREIKLYAVRRGVSLQQIIREALREALERQIARATKAR